MLCGSHVYRSRPNDAYTSIFSCPRNPAPQNIPVTPRFMIAKTNEGATGLATKFFDAASELAPNTSIARPAHGAGSRVCTQIAVWQKTI